MYVHVHTCTSQTSIFFSLRVFFIISWFENLKLSEYMKYLFYLLDHSIPRLI